MTVEHTTYSPFHNNYYTLVKVNSDDIYRYWYDFAAEQQRKVKDTSSKTKLGTKAFIDALGYYQNAEVYVAYISSKEGYLRYTNIEMSMTVTVSKAGTIFSNMGIFRNLSYEGSKHSRTSMELHGYATKKVAELHPNAKLMVNFPVGNMPAIMKEALENTGKPCSTYYKKSKNRPENSVNAENSGNIVFTYKDQTYSLDNANDPWFFHNKCLAPQLDLDWPMVMVPACDLIGVSSWSE